MGSVIHGKSHEALKFLRSKPATLAVFWIYASRTNNEGMAWPSLRGLAQDTGWSVDTCKDARKWLVEHGALERVTEYIRPDWRKLEEKDRTKRVNLDRTEYYRPTGYIEIAEKRYHMLYFGQQEPSTIEEVPPDVLPRRTSAASDMQPGSTELSTNESELDTTTTPRAASNGVMKKPKSELTPVQQIITLVNQKHIMLSGMDLEHIKDEVENTPLENIIAAINLAVDRKKLFWGYVQGILNRQRLERDAELKKKHQEQERDQKVAAQLEKVFAQKRALVMGEGVDDAA